MKIAQLFFICLLLFNQDFASNEDSVVVVRLGLPKTTISEPKDLLLTISIKSNTNRRVIIPKYMSVGYIQDSSGFICIQLQKMEGKTYKNVKPVGTVDNFAPLDKIDSLLRNEQREMKQNLDIISIPFKKGKYRVRVLCFFSAYNKMKDVYSDWHYFNCEKTVYPSEGERMP